MPVTSATEPTPASRPDAPGSPAAHETASAVAVEAAYQARRGEHSATKRALDLLDDRYARARGLTFVAAVGLVLYGAFAHPPVAVWAVAGCCGLAFVVFVVLHARVSTRQFDVERRLTLLDEGLRRVAGRYRVPDEQASRRGDALRDPEHPYTSDLDIFGPGSVFEQLNTTQTPSGAARLAGWLRERAPREVVRARQHAARDLLARPTLREQLAVEGMSARHEAQDASPFLRWAATRSDFSRRITPLLALAALLVGATVVLLATGVTLPPPFPRPWLLTAAAQTLLYLSLGNRLETILSPVCDQQSPLARHHALFRLVEEESFDDPTLLALRERLRDADAPGAGGATASERMQRLEALVGWAAARQNALVRVVANVLLLWDLWCAWALDRWRAQTGHHVATWLDALGEMEALVSLATFAYEHPDFAWPELVEGEVCFEAEALGHPLVAPDQRVCNDVRLGKQPQVLMVTGSNMSGKSTMLRSIGVNAVLAQAGAPVCSRALRMSELSLRSSIRVDDSLEQGVSHFFREVQKLKRVVDALHDESPPLLFLLDEVLHGTNSRERVIGASEVVKQLVAGGAIGAVSSHDLGLVALEAQTGGKVRNVHFEEHVEDGTMGFDFVMKDGPVRTSNALRLMRMVGLDIPITEPELAPSATS